MENPDERRPPQPDPIEVDELDEGEENPPSPPQLLFVVRNSMLLHQGHKVIRREPCEGRFAEMRVGGQIILGAGMDVREIASASPRNEDLLAEPLRMLQDQNRAAAFARLQGTHQAGSPGTYDDDVILHPSDSLRFGCIVRP